MIRTLDTRVSGGYTHEIVGAIEHHRLSIDTDKKLRINTFHRV
jgi:hypothetical protein